MALILDARQMGVAVTGTDRYASSVTRRLLVLRPNTKVLVSNFNKDLCGARIGEGRLKRTVGLWSTCGRNSTYLSYHNLSVPFGLRARHLILSNLDIIPFELPEVYFKSKNDFELNRKRIERRLRRASKIISISKFSKERLIEFFGVPDEIVRVIYLAPSEFSCVPSDEPHELIKGSYILCIGGAEPRKNVKRVIQAYLSLNDYVRKEFKLLIVGGLWRNMDVCPENQVDIIRVGNVSDSRLANLYRRASVLVYPSLYEGFGMPILEAMSIGCPVITSNGSSMPEVGGDASLYVDPCDQNAIADAIQTVLTSEETRNALIDRGLHRANTFSWDRTAQEIESVISEYE